MNYSLGAYLRTRKKKPGRWMGGPTRSKPPCAEDEPTTSEYYRKMKYGGLIDPKKGLGCIGEVEFICDFRHHANKIEFGKSASPACCKALCQYHAHRVNGKDFCHEHYLAIGEDVTSRRDG